MEIIIKKTEQEIAEYVSNMFINQINKKANSVLGFATGSSPISTYQQLILDYEKSNRDWSQVITFNLDEYVGLKQTDEQSYYYFMQKNLFSKINVNKANIHIPSGIGNLVKNIENYEKELDSLGPIDLQILGIGVNGHIAFNEPGSDISSLTRVIDLTQNTIEANKRFFDNVNDVPKTAITMGISSILKSNKIVLVAQGKSKAQAIYELVNGTVSAQWPCTFLQTHKDVVIVVDEAAGSLLK